MLSFGNHVGNISTFRGPSLEQQGLLKPVKSESSSALAERGNSPLVGESGPKAANRKGKTQNKMADNSMLTSSSCQKAKFKSFCEQFILINWKIILIEGNCKQDGIAQKEIVFSSL